MKNLRKKYKGFTLLEVMVVIVILGILASMVVPNLMGNKEKADIQKVVSDIIQLENILDMYKLDNAIYPTTEQNLNALVAFPTQDPQPRRYREGGYLRRLPQDPWGNDYQYRNPGEFGTIDIFSFGPQATNINSDEFIGNWNLQEYN